MFQNTGFFVKVLFVFFFFALVLSDSIDFCDMVTTVETFVIRYVLYYNIYNKIKFCSRAKTYDVIFPYVE